jgi:hypothetical protein
MTTVRQVKRLLTPFVERHDDLELVGRWLYLKPVRHVLRAILIERTGEADRFRPWWAVAPLCEPQKAFPLNWATQITSPARRLWFWKDDDTPFNLAASIELRALPSLRAIETLDDFVAFADSSERFSLTAFRYYHLRSLGVDAARGDLEGARKTCAELVGGRTKWSVPSMRDDFDRVTGELCPLLAANDRAGMARLLHQWEAYTVEKLKIGHIYEPTPFPLELMADERPTR